MNDNTILSLDIIVQQQILLESLESYQRTPQYRHKKINLIKSLIKELEKDTVSDFNKAYGLDEETLITVQRNYMYAMQSFAIRDVPNKVVFSQLLAAYHSDPIQIESTTHRILKKASKL
jgi:hypothetical protein